MSKFLNFDEVSKLCSDNNLKDKINGTKNFDKAKELIKNILPEGKNVSDTTVKSYIKTLKKSSPVEVTSNTDDDINQIQEQTKQADIYEHKEPDEKPLDKKVNKKEPADDASKKDDATKSETKENEKIDGKSEGVKNAIYVDKIKLKEIDAAQHRINDLEESMKLLTVELEGFKQKLPSEQNMINDKLMSLIPNLNELLNSGNDKITVSINKELLSKATKFVDAHSLISLENLIRGGYDLNSTIVQSILIAFIHQNSLL
jgi:hypothetical protein